MLYVIGDLHLSLSVAKPMDIFGGWDNYVERLQEGFSVVKEDDLTVICGDMTWGMNLEQCKLDFEFIDRLPGKKIILKGNHDYWWSTATKAKKFFAENGIESIDILHNNCFFYNDIAICGTRGWFYEEETHGEHDKKVMNRELMRLEASLKAAGDCRTKYCFLHYPPRYNDYICDEVVELLEKYNVQRCYYGHIHGPGRRFAIEGNVGGVLYTMVSADHVGFKPVLAAE
ncbi:MAG: serine/threonine protein phosphatase [Ruminococcaceae bacterium]|nr:serine/threonine protein phosphatase [Oscillospiraceae bacterium]